MIDGAESILTVACAAADYLATSRLLPRTLDVRFGVAHHPCDDRPYLIGFTYFGNGIPLRVSVPMPDGMPA